MALNAEVLTSYNNSIKEVKTNIINDIIRDAFIETPPASFKGKKLKNIDRIWQEQN